MSDGVRTRVRRGPWRPGGSRKIEVLVLGLVRWIRPDGSVASLTRNEIDMVGSRIARSLDTEMITDHDLDDTYYRMQIMPATNGRAERNCRSFNKLVPEAFRPFVEEVQIGYYHNRLIVRYVVSGRQSSLHTMRILRDELTRTAVAQVFRPLDEAFRGAEDGLRLVAVRHTALQLVPRGTRLLREELKKLRRKGYSHAYSVATTTFGVYIFGSRLTPIGRRHYVRLSMSGATVYFAGRRGPDGLLIALVDAIYYGGLYEQTNESGDSLNEDGWSDHQLLNVFALLRDSLRASEGNDSALRTAQVCAVFAILSALIGAIALFAA